ncbi:MAG TPA: acyltransferase [Bacillota bacterium]|nr:acyltransferase [Bacillota bacterium]
MDGINHRQNNFDLIRLLAALQVFFIHGAEHLKVSLYPLLAKLLYYFPGVPVFFVISGFLVLASFDRNPNLQSYFRNRCLRIYPALYFSFGLSVIILVSFHFLNPGNFLKPPVLLWYITYLTFFQYFSPDNFQGFGVGHLNGSLWTIPVELQFYLLVPLISWGLRKRVHQVQVVVGFVILMMLSLWMNQYFLGLSWKGVFFKVVSSSVLSYLWNFLLGGMLYYYWNRIKNLLINKALLWLALYLGYCLIFSNWLGWFTISHQPNLLGIIGYVLLSFCVISAAYTMKNTSQIILRGNDFSYGLYLYHMLVINTMVQLGFRGRAEHLFIALIITLFISCFSWLVIEKQSLKLKDLYWRKDSSKKAFG